MKHKPILFSTPMVKAILEGRKTQTRRVVKDPRRRRHGFMSIARYGEGRPSIGDLQREIELTKDIPPNFPCPYGQVGDRLWVRETHFIGGIKPKEWAWYRSGFDGDEEGVVWRPSIHMPRWASRITLEITEVRVERVQEITEKDAIKEGIPPFAPDGKIQSSTIPRQQFFTLWNSINLKRGYGWEVNPWIWVISFRRLI